MKYFNELARVCMFIKILSESKLTIVTLHDIISRLN